MEIKGLLTGLQTYEQSKINKARDRGGQSSSSSSSSSDRVTLSQDARLYRTGLDQAMNAQEVRSERVEELRERVKDGSYQPDSRNIAEKMILQDMESWFQRS